MGQQLIIQFKLFFKNKVLFGLFSFISVICFGGIMYFIVNGADSVFLFYIITRFIFYINLLFCIMSFVFMVYAKQNDIEDMLLVSDKQKNIFQKSSIMIILILFVIINVTIVLLLIISSIINDQLNVVWGAICDFYLLNIFLPQFVTLLVTFMLSTIKNYYISSLLLLGFLFLTSPYMESFQWMYPPTIPIDQIINYIQLPFAYFLQNSEWSIDYLYGFQNELYKVCALMFWSLLSMIIIMRKKIVKNKAFLCLSVLVGAVTFSAIYIPQSKCRYNRKWDGSYKNLIDYNILDGGNSYIKVSEGDCEITSYNLNVDIKEKLYVKGDIKLESSELQSEYSFTLYRGYRIKELLAENLESYEQHDDIVQLVFDKPVEDVVIKLTYSGYSYEMYSNYQATMLPGYFAWYPMMGKRQIFINAGGLMAGDYGYNPYNRTTHAQFNVSIQSQYPILTNLKKTDDGKYAGIADSFTILGGQSQQKTDGLFQNYYPLNLSNEVNYERLNELRNESIEDVKERLNTIFKISPDFLKKKIFCGSNGLARNNGFGQYAEFEDYLLLSGDYGYNSDILLKYYVYRSDIHPLLKDIIVTLGLDYFSYNEYIKTLQLSIESALKDGVVSDEKQLNEYQNLDRQLKEEIKEKGVQGYLYDLGSHIFN